MLIIPRVFLDMSEDAYGGSVEEMTQRALTTDMLRGVTGNPLVKWRVSDGADGKGKIAYAVLVFEPISGRRVVLGGIEKGRVAEHVHIGGPEAVYTLAGVGNDVDTRTNFGVLAPTDTPLVLTRGAISVHVAGTKHAPGSDTFWVFVYENYGTVDVPQRLK